MYMVIHDLKHPTESLISSFDKMLAKFDEIENKIEFLERFCRQSSMKDGSSSSVFRSEVSS
jgi:hypothetical protein